MYFSAFWLSDISYYDELHLFWEENWLHITSKSNFGISWLQVNAKMAQKSEVSSLDSCLQMPFGLKSHSDIFKCDIGVWNSMFFLLLGFQVLEPVLYFSRLS